MKAMLVTKERILMQDVCKRKEKKKEKESFVRNAGTLRNGNNPFSPQPMDFHGFIDFYGFSWILMDPHGF